MKHPFRIIFVCSLALIVFSTASLATQIGHHNLEQLEENAGAMVGLF